MPTDVNMIEKALVSHHEYVRNLGYTPVMTVLIGCPNYGLDIPGSRYDTYTFTLPTLWGIATGHEFAESAHVDEHGRIIIKNIRPALTILQSMSLYPAPIEWFAGKYRYVEPEFKTLVDRITAQTLRCSAKGMLDGAEYIAHKRRDSRVTLGERLCQILRMECMTRKYYDLNADILELDEPQRTLAQKAMLDPKNRKWQNVCTEHATQVDKLIQKYREVKPFTQAFEENARRQIEDLQVELVRLAVARNESTPREAKG